MHEEVLQGAVGAVGHAAGGVEAGRKAIRNAMHDYCGSGSPDPAAIAPTTPPSGSSSAWIRLPGCNMHASFSASDAFQDLHIPAPDAEKFDSGGVRARPSDDGSASRWNRFGHWQAPRCAVMGAGGCGVAGGASMHHVEVAQELLLGAWAGRKQSHVGGVGSIGGLHGGALRIGLPKDTVRSFKAWPTEVY